MTSLRNLEAFLSTNAPRGSGLRPFVCDGDPTSCVVALVGHSPASSLDADFWDFWSEGAGFDKERWFDAYKFERATRPLKPGRTRRHAVSPTRRRIERFVNGLREFTCFETNLYWDASSDVASHPEKEMGDIIGLLEKIPSLRLVVCHHHLAYKRLRNQLTGVDVIEVPHFNNRRKGWTNEAAFNLGREMKSRVKLEGKS